MLGHKAGSLYPRTSPPHTVYRQGAYILGHCLPTQGGSLYTSSVSNLLKGELMFLGRASPSPTLTLGGACTISGSLIPSGVRSLHVPLSFRGRSSCPGVGVPVLGWKFRGEAISLGRCLPRSFYPGGRGSPCPVTPDPWEETETCIQTGL